MKNFFATPLSQKRSMAQGFVLLFLVIAILFSPSHAFAEESAEPVEQSVLTGIRSELLRVQDSLLQKLIKYVKKLQNDAVMLEEEVVVEKKREIAVTSPRSFSRNLSAGLRGDRDTERLQLILREQKLYDREIDGIFDDATTAAVVAFQEKYGIEPATGFVGELTRRQLNILSAAAPVISANASHSCNVTPFSISLNKGEAAIYAVRMEPTTFGNSFRLTTGSLPPGIRARLSEISGTAPNITSLTLETTENTSAASYSIRVVYVETTSGNSTTCPLNLVVK